MKEYTLELKADEDGFYIETVTACFYLKGCNEQQARTILHFTNDILKDYLAYLELASKTFD